MNKSELIAAIAEKAGLSKSDSAKALDAFTETITKQLATGDAVALVGFGTFTVNDRAARTGINPKTKESIEIPARKVPVFKAGKALKDATNGN